MAAPQSTGEFIHLLRRSQLLEDERLREYLTQLSNAPKQPRAFANRLIDDGLITNLQAGLLLKGKWRNFVISGKYKLLEHIGAGGMGQVFLCQHMKMGRRVAIKVLPAEKARDDISRERFYREARAVAALNHPNIVRAHDIDHDGPLHFLVMEYVDGANLQDIVKKRGPLEIGRAVEYTVQAACGLQHAHEAGLIHRDVKPSNLLLDRAGQVKLLDLGLARFFAESGDPLTRRLAGKNVIGTADYLAPEQARDSHAADARADIYALGATLYFLLAGHATFKTGTIAQKLLQHQSEKPTPIREVRSEVPDELAAVIERTLEKDPDRRYSDCLSLIDALNPFVPKHVPVPDGDEIPQLCPAARSNETPSGRFLAPERSGRRARPPSTTPPQGQPIPQEPMSPRKPRSARRRPLSLAARIGLAAALSVGGILSGVVLGKLLSFVR